MPSDRITVTQIGEFVRHHGCERRLRLEHDGRAEAQSLPQITRLFSPLDPVLQEAGRQREDGWEQQLVNAGLAPLFPQGRPDRDEDRSWTEFLRRADEIGEGQAAYAREVEVTGRIGAFEVTGRIDFVLVLWQDGRPRLCLVEAKASRKDQTYHRVQVATYQLLVRGLLDDHVRATAGNGPVPTQVEVVITDTTLAITGYAATAGGRGLHPDHVEAIVVRVDEDTNRPQDLLAVQPLALARYQDDVRHLLAAGGPFEQTLSQPLDILPYALEPKCDGCVFNVHCLPESARLRRLELLGLDPATCRALRSAGVATLDDLAVLDSAGPTAGVVRRQPGFEADLAHLAARAAVRARTLPGGDVLTRPDGSPVYEVTSLAHSGRGTLPEHTVDGHPLVRAYLDVEVDYVENRVVALAAHVTTSDGTVRTPFIQDGIDGDWRPGPDLIEEADGSERPLRGTDIVEINESGWTGDHAEDTSRERSLVEQFLTSLIAALRHEADDDLAAVHFYVWNGSDITALVEASARAGSDVLAHLAELLGLRDGVEDRPADPDQLIYSSLSDEVQARFATGWTSTGLAPTVSLRWFGQAHHWTRRVDGETVALDRHFSRDQFDFVTTLGVRPDGSWANARDEPGASAHRFEVRSRNYNTVAAPYWYALWGRLDEDAADNAATRRAIQAYNAAASPAALRALLAAHTHALRWVEERTGFKNGEIRKPPLDLGQIARFSLGPRNLGRAALDVIRLDHKVKTTEWTAHMLRPPALRVPTGATLPLRNVRPLDRRTLVADIDVAGYDVALDDLRLRSKFDAGDFARVTPADADPHAGQRLGAIAYGGRTAVVEDVDWDRATVRLSIIPGRETRYTVASSWADYAGNYDDSNFPFAHATLDESLSDYVASKVDARLRGRRGDHAYAWLDPTDPQPPPAPALGVEKQAAAEALVAALRLPNGHVPDDDQRAACLDGLSTRIQLLLGPPGTGKTTTTGVATLVRVAALHVPGDLVLVAGPTHTAVDTALRAIADSVGPVAAAGEAAGLPLPPVHVAKIHSGAVTDPSPDGIDDVSAGDRDGLRTFIDTWTGRTPSERGVLVLGGTTSGILKAADRYGARFRAEALVVDEASMLLFPHFLALTSLVHPEGRVFLAGDHRQLAPIVAHDWETEDRPPVVLYQPHVSAYEAVRRLRSGALTDNQVTLSSLSRTFRLPAPVRALIAPVYELDGVTLRGRSALSPLDGLGDGDPLRAVMEAPEGLFLVLHDERASKAHNPFEGDLIRRLLDADLDDDSVALITPHRAQRSYLQGRFGDHSAVGLADTVNRLQGGERPSIVVSGTVSDPAAVARRAGFVLGLERANVAFSRPQERLVVVASRALVDHIPADLDHYEAAMLWKNLRAICTRRLAEGSEGGHGFVILTPPA